MSLFYYFKAVVVFFLVILLSGCMGLVKQGETIDSALATGQVGNALALAEEEDLDKEDVLASLNKGMLRRISGNYKASNQIFEIAKQKIEELYDDSISEQVGTIIINDKLRSYSGDRYEQVLLHAYMAMNYIQLDDLDAARVEMMQADVKMQEWDETPEEDPFVRYLSGMIFEALGEKDEALIAYRKAKQVYQSTKDKQNLKIPTILKKDLMRMLSEENLKDELRLLKKELRIKHYRPRKIAKNSGDLIIVLNTGLAPVRKENTLMTATGGDVVDMVRIAIPKYQQTKQQYSAKLRSESASLGNLELIEDVDALARNALDNDLPVITTRAIARAIVKHQTQKKAEDKGGVLGGAFMTVFNMASEQADTRSWTTLPQTIQMARVRLIKGSHKLNIEIYNAAGTLVDTIQKEVFVKSGQTVFLTEHWLAPNMSLHVVQK